MSTDRPVDSKTLEQTKQQIRDLVARNSEVAEIQRRLELRREELQQRNRELEAFKRRVSRLGDDVGIEMAEDDLTPRAAELVLLTGKASTSMMQTKLKVGFNRASRIVDELEQVGIVGPQDPRNPAVPRAVYGPENWIRSTEDVDSV